MNCAIINNKDVGEQVERIHKAVAIIANEEIDKQEKIYRLERIYCYINRIYRGL